MSSSSIADQQLLAAASVLCTRRHSTPIIQRWLQEPAIAGMFPADLIELIAKPTHLGSNDAFAALARLGQQGDNDAIVAMLASVRLGLWGVVHSRCDHREDAFDELLAHTTFILRRLDPTLDRLYDRILGRARAAVLRVHRHQTIETPCADMFRFRSNSYRDDPVGDQVVARLSLSHLAHLAHTGAIARTEWNTLVAVRLSDVRSDEIDERSGSQVRAQTSRLGRRLAGFVDAA
jgi:hypothetical protein